MQSNTIAQNKGVTLRDHTRDQSISRGPVDIPFMLVTLLLLTIGVVMVLSASYASAYYDVSKETGGNATYYFARAIGIPQRPDVIGLRVWLIHAKKPSLLERAIS